VTTPSRLRNGRRIGRRAFVGMASLAAASALVTAREALAQPGNQPDNPRFGAYPFSLGVNSGDPTPSGMVLWTRLAPDPLGGGGMGDQPVPVQWELAEDEGFRRVARRGTELATVQLGHSVHAEVEGLAPGRWYWYRFKAGSELSPVGRTRTAPAAGTMPDRLRFAFASCQHYEQGYYTAYRHMAQEDLDMVFHLGDYMYEGAAATGRPRIHNGPEPVTLADYRNRHALYRSDPDLQAAQAAFPWVVTWDDHEVDNNYADEVPQDPDLHSRE
jgi:alkaline phosphatase D